MPFDYCWRQLFFDRFHEIPVELEHAERITGARGFLAVALCAAYESANTFADYSVEVLNVCCFDIFVFGVSKHDSFHFADELSVFSNFDKLPIVDAVFLEEFGHDDRVVVIAVRKNV